MKFPSIILQDEKEVELLKSINQNSQEPHNNAANVPFIIERQCNQEEFDSTPKFGAAKKRKFFKIKLDGEQKKVIAIDGENREEEIFEYNACPLPEISEKVEKLEILTNRFNKTKDDGSNGQIVTSSGFKGIEYKTKDATQENPSVTNESSLVTVNLRVSQEGKETLDALGNTPLVIQPDSYNSASPDGMINVRQDVFGGVKLPSGIGIKKSDATFNSSMIKSGHDSVLLAVPRSFLSVLEKLYPLTPENNHDNIDGLPIKVEGRKDVLHGSLDLHSEASLKGNEAFSKINKYVIQFPSELLRNKLNFSYLNREKKKGKKQRKPTSSNISGIEKVVANAPKISNDINKTTHGDHENTDSTEATEAVETTSANEAQQTSENAPPKKEAFKTQAPIIEMDGFHLDLTNNKKQSNLSWIVKKEDTAKNKNRETISFEGTIVIEKAKYADSKDFPFEYIYSGPNKNYSIQNNIKDDHLIESSLIKDFIENTNHDDKDQMISFNQTEEDYTLIGIFHKSNEFSESPILNSVTNHGNQKDTSRPKSIHQSCFNMDLKSVQQYLDSGENPQQIGFAIDQKNNLHTGLTPIQAVLLSLDLGLEDISPKMLKKQAARIIKLLINKGAVSTEIEKDLVFYCITKNLYEIIDVLFENNVKLRRHGFEMVGLAIQIGHMETLAILEKHSCSINIKNDRGNRPFLDICSNTLKVDVPRKHRKTSIEEWTIHIKNLMDLGLNIEATDTVGATALIRSIVTGNENMMWSLINCGANPSVKFKNGISVVHLAAACLSANNFRKFVEQTGTHTEIKRIKINRLQPDVKEVILNLQLSQ